MITTLQPKGDNFIVELDGQLLHDLKLDPNEPLEVTVIDGVVTLVPAHADDKQEKLARVLERLESKFGGALKELAK